MTHRGVAVHNRDGARTGGEGFRAHDREGFVEEHHLAATHTPGGMHAIVAARTPTFDEAVFPQLKEGHVHLVAMNPCYAYRQEPFSGGERMILVTDRPLGSWGGKPWKASDP